MPQFTFTSYILRGRTEREYAVEVTYSVEDEDVQIVRAVCEVPLTGEDYNVLHDQACDRAGKDIAEWLADYVDWLGDSARPAESYIPGMAA